MTINETALTKLKETHFPGFNRPNNARNSNTILDKYLSLSAKSQTPMSYLQMYAQKVCGEIKCVNSMQGNKWMACLSFSQAGKESLSAEGVGDSKKIAGHAAADKILLILSEQKK